MKKLSEYLKTTGFILLILMLIPLILLFLAEPPMRDDEPQMQLELIHFWIWLAITSFSILLITIGHKLNNLKSSKK
jgi:Mn2+/Fe2+ NRAMP family transporter